MKLDIESISRQITTNIKEGRQELPGLPDIAMRVREAIKREDDIGKVSKIIQSDIPLMARIIQIANSPLYRGVVPVEDCQKAISRLGIDVTKNLVTSFAVRRAFTGKGARTRRYIEELWKHSVQVAAIAFILARITPQLHPDHAMLAALVHDVGVLPLMQYFEEHPDLLDDEATTKEIISKLRIELGVMVLRHWRFDYDLIEVVGAAEDWLRDIDDTPDYGDVVLISQLHAAFGKPESTSMPSLDQVPAVAKFPVFKLGPDASMELLTEAQDEMKDLQKLLIS